MRAFITGISGQDGSYLTELLLAKGYEVHGLVRPQWQPAGSHIAHLCADPHLFRTRLFLHSADLVDAIGVEKVVTQVRPDELYHLAGQTHVGRSFEIPERTTELIANATLRLLEVARKLNPPPKIFHASSSEIFGQPGQAPQNESTPYAPVSPYGCAKAFATQLVGVYRRSYGLFACNGILFNHESPRRGEGFVTRKICRAAAAIQLGRETELTLGDTRAERDWGHARDYVEGMWLMLQAEKPDDYVLATGQLHTVQDVVQQAFDTVGLDWCKFLRRDPKISRPTEPRLLVGDATKARTLLGWQPRTTFEELVREMTQIELRRMSSHE